MSTARDQNKSVLLHMNLIEGIGKDHSGMHYAIEHGAIAGVHSTKSHILKMAKQEGLITIHRLFITDFQSVQSGLIMTKSSSPDFVELTPGIIPRIIRRLRIEQQKPIIASSLVESARDVQNLQKAGASNVVSSTQSLWFRENFAV